MNKSRAPLSRRSGLVGHSNEMIAIEKATYLHSLGFNMNWASFRRRVDVHCECEI